MILVDTNLLLRIANPVDPQHGIATSAVAKLRTRGDVLCLVPQNFYEFWVASTRPTAVNGLGLSAAEANQFVATFRSGFLFLADKSTLYAEWEALVTSHGILGKPAHDARLVAAMQTHGVSRLLTLNVRDFARFPGIVAIDPGSV